MLLLIGDTTGRDMVSLESRKRTFSLSLTHSVMIRCLVFFSTLTTLISSQAFARELHYNVDLRDTKSHKVHVTMKPVGFTQKDATFQMPIWAPGAYSVTGYGRYVKNFEALDKIGHSLPVTQVNENRWSVPNGKSIARIEYDVLDSHNDTTSLYFAMADIDSTIFFANATCLFGYFDDDKNASATVDYEKPVGWKLVCPLYDPKLGAAPNDGETASFTAKNYDVLADAPIGAAPNLHLKTFGAGKATYDLAIISNGTFSDAKLDSLTQYLKQIVVTECDFFHDTPFERYLFLVNAPSMSRMPSMSQGALEHANSSDYLLVNLSWSQFKQNYLSIFSHEFFHLWDVKRIHSSLLGPFDYTSRVMTTSLWMAEGITEYYAHTLLVRDGIETPKQFYNQIGQWLQVLQNFDTASTAKSLEQLSIDESAFNLNDAILFYIKGPLVGLMLDLEIRNRTANKKSLDDVMLALNEDAKHGKTFKDEDLIHKVEKIAGIDLTDFYKRYIHGDDSLPIDRYLAMMGVGQSTPGTPSALGLSPDGQLLVASVNPISPLGKAGVQQNDILLAVNGTKLTIDNVDLFSKMKDSSVAKITIKRGEQTMELSIDFGEKGDPHHKKEGAMEVDLDAPPTVKAIRKGILGS